jgi:CheY-like chemotaxis protein
MVKKGKFIFVVDDDEVTRNALKDYLTRKGFEVKTVENGLDVLVFLRYHKPDLIISDVQMPKCDGITLLQGLKNRPETRDIPVIFISGFDNKEVFKKAEELGAEHFLLKPFRLNEIHEIINKILEAEEDIIIHWSSDSVE